MKADLSFFRAIGNRRGGQAKAAILALTDEVERLQSRLAEAEAERVHLADLNRECWRAIEAGGETGGGIVRSIVRIVEERDTLAARVRELEAPGECQSVHKLRAALADLVEAVSDEGPVTAAVAPAWDRACAVLSAGWREERGRDGGEGSTDALATLRRRIAELHEVLCSDADEATLRRAVSSLVYETRGHGEDR